jgi:hypothetical protein
MKTWRKKDKCDENMAKSHFLKNVSQTQRQRKVVEKLATKHESQ